MKFSKLMKFSVIHIISIIVLMMSIDVFANDPCQSSPSQSPEDQVQEHIERNIAPVQTLERNQPLFDTNVSYSALKTKVGSAKISLKTIDGKITSLVMSGQYNFMGSSSGVEKRASIEELMSGQPIELKLDEEDINSRSILILKPLADISEHGGSAILRIWDGDKYVNETIKIQKAGNSYQAFHNNVSQNTQIDEVNLNVRGASLSEAYVHNYQVGY